MNTTYKAFMAEAAKSLYTEMVGKAIEAGKISPFVGTSFNENKEEYEHIAIQASFAAETLAKALDDNWSASGDHTTVFFDVQDSLTSRIEDELANIAEKLNEIEEEMEREYGNEHDS